MVTTPVYEGPLDLLLQLIEQTALEITGLVLAQVTDQIRTGEIYGENQLVIIALNGKRLYSNLVESLEILLY